MPTNVTIFTTQLRLARSGFPGSSHGAVLCCAVLSNKLYMVLSQHERILVWRPDLQKLSSFRNGAVRTWKCGAFSFRTVLRHHKLSSPRIEALEIWNSGGLQRLQKRVAISESHPTSDA
jgi:hypothetical protein